MITIFYKETTSRYNQPLFDITAGYDSIEEDYIIDLHRRAERVFRYRTKDRDKVEEYIYRIRHKADYSKVLIWKVRFYDKSSLEDTDLDE